MLLTGRDEDEAQRSEREAQATGAEVTIVRCAWFMQSFSEDYLLDAILSGEVVLPATDDQLEPFVDADDIADVAVAALTEPGHAGQVYELTGPRLLSFPEAVAEIAKASGREIDYVPVSVEEYAAGAAEHGLPAELVGYLTYLFGEVLGHSAQLTDGVQRALGRPTRDFGDYAARAAATGVWNPPPTDDRPRRPPPGGRAGPARPPPTAATGGPGSCSAPPSWRWPSSPACSTRSPSRSCPDWPAPTTAPSSSTMQQINRAIENPAFFLSFAGALVLTALAAELQRRHGPAVATRWVVAALVLYAIVLAVTSGINIPLNDQLDRAGDPDRIGDLAHVRDRFEGPWVAANIVRTLGSTAAVAALARALFLHGHTPADQTRSTR